MGMSEYEAMLYLRSRYRSLGAMPALGTLYVAFASADLTRYNVTANLIPLTNGLTRLPIDTIDANWEDAVDDAGLSVIRNIPALTGGAASADINGGLVIPYYGLYDNATAGNLIRNGVFSTPKPILNGDTIQIPPGALEILN